MVGVLKAFLESVEHTAGVYFYQVSTIRHMVYDPGIVPYQTLYAPEDSESRWWGGNKI